MSDAFALMSAVAFPRLISEDGVALQLKWQSTAPTYSNPFRGGPFARKAAAMPAPGPEEGSHSPKKRCRTLDCKDYGRVSSTAVLCKDGIPGLWQLTLAILAYHPLAVPWQYIS